MSQDPLGFDAGDSNVYRYANNRATDSTDPSGEKVFLLYGVMSNGGSWFPQFNTVLNAEWSHLPGAQPQDVQGFQYRGGVKSALESLFNDLSNVENQTVTAISRGLGNLIPTGTTVFAATRDLSSPSWAVKNGAIDFREELQKFQRTHPEQPINIIAHSNGTMVALLALYGTTIKVNRLVLAGSPLDPTIPSNTNMVESVLTENVQDFGRLNPGHMYNVFTSHDLVTWITGGARAWGIAARNFSNEDWSNKVLGRQVPVPPTLKLATVNGPLFGISRPGLILIPGEAVDLRSIEAHVKLADSTYGAEMDQYARWTAFND
jgi:pimeloyl-ACP methyl ester carboxylesterase